VTTQLQLINIIIIVINNNNNNNNNKISAENALLS